MPDAGPREGLAAPRPQTRRWTCTPLPAGLARPAPAAAAGPRTGTAGAGPAGSTGWPPATPTIGRLRASWPRPCSSAERGRSSQGPWVHTRPARTAVAQLPPLPPHPLHFPWLRRSVWGSCRSQSWLGSSEMPGGTRKVMLSGAVLLLFSFHFSFLLCSTSEKTRPPTASAIARAGLGSTSSLACCASSSTASCRLRSAARCLEALSSCSAVRAPVLPTSSAACTRPRRSRPTEARPAPASSAANSSLASVGTASLDSRNFCAADGEGEG